MRSSISLLSVALIVAVNTIIQPVFAAPAINNDKIYKRDDSLVRGFGLGLDGVAVGVKSTIDGVVNPKTRGSREDTERAAAEAGENVGGAIGSALNL